MRENKTKTTDALGEKAQRIKIGRLTFKVKPLTLLQVKEIGEELEGVDLSDFDENKTINSNDSEDVANVKRAMMVQSYVFSKHEGIESMTNALIKSLFRSDFKRKLFGWYIRKNLTMENYGRIYANLHANFDFAFFLQSLIFLKGATMTEKKEE